MDRLGSKPIFPYQHYLIAMKTGWDTRNWKFWRWPFWKKWAAILNICSHYSFFNMYIVKRNADLHGFCSKTLIYIENYIIAMKTGNYKRNGRFQGSHFENLAAILIFCQPFWFFLLAVLNFLDTVYIQHGQTWNQFAPKPLFRELHDLSMIEVSENYWN